MQNGAFLRIFARFGTFLCISVHFFLPKWPAEKRKFAHNRAKMCKKRFYAIPPLVIPPFACHRQKFRRDTVPLPSAPWAHESQRQIVIRIAAGNCPLLGTFKTNSLLPTRRSGGRITGPCFARFVFLTFRGPLASHDSNPYPNRSRIARYNATKFGAYRGLARVLKSPSNPQSCRKKESILEKGASIFCAKPWYAPNPGSKEI